MMVDRLQPRDIAENSDDENDEEKFLVNEQAEKLLNDGYEINDIIRLKRKKLRKIYLQRRVSKIYQHTKSECEQVYRYLKSLGYRGRVPKNDFEAIKAKYESLPPLEKPSTSLIQRRKAREN